MSSKNVLISTVFNVLTKFVKTMTLDEFKLAVKKAETLAIRIRNRFDGVIQQQVVKHPELGYQCKAKTLVMLTTTQDEIDKYKKKTTLYTVYISKTKAEKPTNEEEIA